MVGRDNRESLFLAATRACHPSACPLYRALPSEKPKMRQFGSPHATAGMTDACSFRVAQPSAAGKSRRRQIVRERGGLKRESAVSMNLAGTSWRARACARYQREEIISFHRAKYVPFLSNVHDERTISFMRVNTWVRLVMYEMYEIIIYDSSLPYN